MTEELIKQLLEAGVHFGHQTKRWNPKMAPFIFGKRGHIYIVDLEKTAEHLVRARDFLKGLARKGEMILFVGTKKQAQDITTEFAKSCGMYSVSQRWLGGLLTNFATIKKSVARLKDIEKMKDDGRFASFTKKEVSLLMKEHEKLERNLGGIKDMEKLPAALFVIDSKKEMTAIAEAKKLRIPIVALVDTNCDPGCVDYPIPGNDDAIKSIRLIASLICDSINEGRKGFLEYLAQANIKAQAQEISGDGVSLEEQAVKVGEDEVAELADEVVDVVESDDGSAKKITKAKAVEPTKDMAKGRRKIRR